MQIKRGSTAVVATLLGSFFFLLHEAHGGDELGHDVSAFQSMEFDTLTEAFYLAQLDAQTPFQPQIQEDWLGDESAVEAPATNATPSKVQQGLSPGQYQVVQGDTLWNIARRLRFTGISVVQTMEAIFRYNASAFDGDDVSSLKVGSMIWLPTGDEVRLEFGTFVSPGIERIDPERMQTQALLSSINRDLVLNRENALVNGGAIPYQDQSERAAQSIGDTSEANDALSAGRSEGQADLDAALDTVSATQSDTTDKTLNGALSNANNAGSGLGLSAPEAGMLVAEETVESVDPASQLPLEPQIERQQIEPQTVPQTPASGYDFISWLLASFLVVIAAMVFWLKRPPKESQNSDSRLQTLGSGSIDLRYDELDGSEIKVFDESDTEIFPDESNEVSSRFFDSMIDPMVDAEMYLSVGKVAEAIDVLQEERFAKPNDVACRVRLMQVFIR